MFIVLRRTVRIVNSQTKSYFVNKLQSYDDLIRDKENKLQEIDELIKDKEKEILKDNNKELVKNGYDFDTNVIDLFNSTKHANFIINKGEATGKDIIELINIIKKEVKKNYNITLQLEQIIIE